MTQCLFSSPQKVQKDVTAFEHVKDLMFCINSVSDGSGQPYNFGLPHKKKKKKHNWIKEKIGTSCGFYRYDKEQDIAEWYCLKVMSKRFIK